MASTFVPPTLGDAPIFTPIVPPAPAELPVDTLLDGGRYRLGPVLGQGGFGITYAAMDERLRRRVAIKELFPDGARREEGGVVVPEAAAPAFARARERFLREATTLARFGHPGIVRIWATLEERGTAYLVLERLDGRTLAEELRVRRGPFTAPEALDVAGQVAAALAVVHRAGVLHRDLSPANLVRTAEGRVVLIDFGLAQPFVADRTTSMTRIVTPGYAPPEQYGGSARFAPRSDVYALGATLYRLLTARTPAGAVERAAGAPLVAPWRLNATVSRQVSAGVEAALALDPGERPASVDDLLARLGVEPAPFDLPEIQVLDLRDPEAPVVALAPTAAPEELDEPDEVVDGTGPEPAVASYVVPAPAVVAPAPAPAPAVAGVVPRGRPWITVPLGLAAVALASAQPVTLTLLLGLGVAPVVATAGDRLLRPHRSVAWLPAWWARNVLVGAVRALGAAVILVVGLLLWWGTDAFGSLAAASPWVLRATGVGAGWVLASSIGRGGPGFRSHVALDELAARLVPRGRPTVAAAALVLACLAVVAAGVWFTPEAWPFGT